MKFFLLKLGCPKNDVDADYISARLIDDGHQLTTDPEKAHSLIINTCGFIQAAREESINEILKLSLLKNSGYPKTLYATGCLSQRYGIELLRGIPELDGVFGLGEIDALARAVATSSRLVKPVFKDARRLDYLCGSRRHIADNLPYAYLKISDGCNRLCSFCAIPFIRGKYRSRSLKAVVDEARFLADHGKREIIIVSQEATLYGHDLKERSNIINLLQELEKIEKISWIRLLYLYPDRVNGELIAYMAQSRKTLKYFDLPLQHINDDILKRMRRRTSRRQIEQLLFKIKTIIPEAVLRTTFIVGFPGESKEQFKELRTFIETYRFDRVGVFSFSLEEGTVAAKMRPLVSEKVKNTRLDDLMTLQQEIAFAKNNSLIGTNKKVIIDSSDDSRMARGRTEDDCPDIDQEIVIHGKNLKADDIRIVKITGANGYDLMGEVLQG
ncbi:MAG: 30S ribosomal protein S12 methylthiotransferase RimO [candidate division Zixibacteria bacterium]|nr:30S ribosomal protein S12 methylthiotransferase RimO [candidate division Zixibacteria bacterium]